MASSIQLVLIGNGEDASVVVIVPGEDKPLVALGDHPNFNAIVQAARDQDYGVVDLFDIAETVAQNFERLSRRITTANGTLYLDGEPMSGVIVDHILRAMEAGLTEWQPLANFIENVAANPNPGSVTQLYDWLKRENFTIDADGMIVGYKGVNALPDGTYQSISAGKATVDGKTYTGNIPNPIGSVIEMPRGEVQYDPANGCSTGLHVGNYEYASGFARGAVLEVRVNPADVVSVPLDCAAQKMRTCRYTVHDVFKQAAPYSEPVVGGSFEPSFSDFDPWGDWELDTEQDFDLSREDDPWVCTDPNCPICP